MTTLIKSVGQALRVIANYLTKRKQELPLDVAEALPALDGIAYNLDFEGKPVSYDEAVEAYGSPYLYEEACELYSEWAEQQKAADPRIVDYPQPNKTLSEEKNGVWYLQNVNGPIATVGPRGEVAYTS